MINYRTCLERSGAAVTWFFCRWRRAGEGGGFSAREHEGCSSEFVENTNKKACFLSIRMTQPSKWFQNHFDEG